MATRWHRHRCVAARYAYLGIAGVRWTSYNLEGDAYKGGALDSRRGKRNAGFTERKTDSTERREEI